jgi:MFS family permease
MALAFVATSFVAPRLGPRSVPLGAAVTAVGALLVALVTVVGGATLPLAPLMAALVVQGTGQGLIMPAVLGAVLQGVPAASAGSASGVLTTTQQTGNALGVAVGGALFFALAGDTGSAADFGTALAACCAWTAAGAGITTVMARPWGARSPRFGPEGAVASER